MGCTAGVEQPALPNGLHQDATPNGLPQTDSESDSDSVDFAQDPAQEAAMQDGEDGSNSAYNSRQPSGAPQPLDPQLVTLSLLPRSQWQSLVHLEAIKVGHLPCELNYVCLDMLVLVTVFARHASAVEKVVNAKGHVSERGGSGPGLSTCSRVYRSSLCTSFKNRLQQVSLSVAMLVIVYACGITPQCNKCMHPRLC